MAINPIATEQTTAATDLVLRPSYSDGLRVG